LILLGFRVFQNGSNQQKVTNWSHQTGLLFSERLPNAALRAVSTLVAASSCMPGIT